MASHSSLKEKELLGKIQESLAVAKQAAQQLIAQYKTPLCDFIRNHLGQVDVEESAKKTFINAFKGVVSDHPPNDFYQRLLQLARESTNKKGNPRLIVLPPLDIQASVPVTNICDEALLGEITQRVRDIRASVGELFRIYQSDLLERVKPYVNYHVQSAEDVVQDTYERAYRKIYTLFYDKYGSPKTSVEHQFLSWLHRIALRIIADAIAKDIRRNKGRVVDYPEDEEGEEFGPPDLKTDVSKQASIEALMPKLLHEVASHKPHVFFVFVLKGLISWTPTEIIERFSEFTLEELSTEFRNRCIHMHQWDADTVNQVLNPLQDQLRVLGKKRLRDYFGEDPENDIQMWYRSAIRTVKKRWGEDQAKRP